MPRTQRGVALGLDGCPAGWFAWRWHRAGFTHHVYPTLLHAWDANPDAAAIVVDIPIGLPRAVRGCEVDAKRILGRCNSRVFLTPSREVVGAASYPEANALSRRLLDKGISKQFWNIAPKIREADALLRKHPRAREVVRECHPEICFWGLSGRVIEANKKTDEGFQERANVLEQSRRGTWPLLRDAIASTPRKVAARDDIVDAMVAALTALAIVEEPAKVRTLPEKPPRDELGIRVEMVYRVL